MDITSLEGSRSTDWNKFVIENYPPIGGFMHSWEWGAFQEQLDRKIERFAVTENNEIIALFALVFHPLSLGFRYAYCPRGPAIAASIMGNDAKLVELFTAMRSWVLQRYPDLVFLRLESPLRSLPEALPRSTFIVPAYYIQPRHNLAVAIRERDEDILKSFHPSTRSNIPRAEKRGVTVEIKTHVTDDDRQLFGEMMKDTITRNSGTNAYPNAKYFDALYSYAWRSEAELDDFTLLLFHGYSDNEPAATHAVVFFGKTATYLYGASRSKHLASKVTTYLHWSAIREAKRRGMTYYDLGGVDEKRWPKLTVFKRQFRGEAFDYVGNIDIPVRPLLYRCYTEIKRLRLRP